MNIGLREGIENSNFSSAVSWAIDRRSLARSLAHSETGRIVIIGILAFVVRATAMVIIESFRFESSWEMGFEMGRLADALATGKGFSMDGEASALMPPLFPAILSVVFRLFGSYTLTSAAVVLLVQSAASALTGVVIYMLGKTLFGPAPGLVGAMLWIIHPGAINYSIRRVWASSFTALGIAVIVLVLLRLRRGEIKPALAALCGVLMGLTALLNPVVLMAFPLMVLWLLLSARKERRRAFVTVGILTLGMILTITPWLVRNALVFDRFVPIKGTFGFVLWQGNNPYVDQVGAAINPFKTLAEQVPPQEIEYLSSLNEVELSRSLQGKAIEFISNNPSEFFSYTTERIALFWTVGFQDDSGPGGGITAQIVSALFGGILGLAIVGFAISHRRWKMTSLLILVLVSYPLAYYLTVTDTYRYRFPIEPLLLVFAAFTIHRTSVNLKRQFEGRLPLEPRRTAG